MSTRRPLTAAVAAAILLLTGCSEDPGAERPDEGVQQRDDDLATATVHRDVPEDDLGELPVYPGPWTAPMAIAPGLLPPTNSWIAPAVFDPAERPVFTGVLSARPAADGVTVGLPRPSADRGVVMGSHRDDVPLEIDADAYTLTGIGAVTATLTYHRQDGTPVGDLQLAEGWPYIAYRARAEQTVGLPEGVHEGDGALELEVDGTVYRLLSDGEVEGSGLALDEGDQLHLYAVPEEADAGTVEALDAGAVALEGSAVQAVDADPVSTTLTLTTEEDAETVLAVPPHRDPTWEESEQLAQGYPSILGDLRLIRGSSLTWETPAQEPVVELDLSGLAPADADRVEELLEQDVADLEFTAPDSYHGGKEVQRAAMLYVLARQLGRDDLAEEVGDATVEQLDRWFDPEGCATRTERCFHYDERLRGLVARAPSYGSDEFNDHHFHYGHLLYAAGILAADDPELAERWAPVADLVAREYGAPAESSHFPAHRVFDVWRGHSFASGTAPFEDGNNQESSSEAVNAWVGLSLWARARDDEELARTASWLLAEETAATEAYWLDVDRELPEEFDAPHASLNWQGKRDFATFFSAEPSAVVGIQLIPMGPTQVDYLSRHPGSLERMLDAVGETTPGAPLIDLDLLGLALVDPEAARGALEEFTAEDMDPGMSLSYASALVLSR